MKLPASLPAIFVVSVLVAGVGAIVLRHCHVWTPPVLQGEKLI